MTSLDYWWLRMTGYDWWWLIIKSDDKLVTEWLQGDEKVMTKWWQGNESHDRLMTDCDRLLTDWWLIDDRLMMTV